MQLALLLSVAGPAAIRASPAAPTSWPNCTSGGSRQDVYSVTTVSRDPMPDGAAFISHVNGSSDFNFNFATAWFPTSPSAGPDGLVVRVVECNPDHHDCPDAEHPEWSNAGALVVIPADLSIQRPSAAYVSAQNVTWGGATPPPHANKSLWGAADPRIAYREKDQTYYLTWDNCTQNCYPQRTTLLSTTKDPFDPDSWTLQGPVFPFSYSSGASLLFRDGKDDQGPHLGFVCNSNTADEIFLVESWDGLSWTKPADPAREIFMEGRPDCWDSNGVAAGPQPERLSTGDYLYIYNIDTGFPYHPNPLGRCAIGWAILDRDDPSKIVARADGPLLIAELDWETCPEGKGRQCQEPMVVFSTGLKPLGNDEFYVIYGGADTDVGLARVKVDVHTMRLSV